MIHQGQSCTITSDVVVGGRTAFRQGENVVVQNVDPNPGAPEYRYVVYSNALGQYFQLREQDLTPMGAPAQPQVPYAPMPPVMPPVGPPGPGMAPPKKSRTGLIVGIVIGLVVLIAAVLVIVFVVIKPGSKDGGGDDATGAGPRETFEQFWDYVKAGKMDSAWELLADSAKQGLTYSDFKTTVPEDLPSITVVSAGQTGSSGWVRYKMTYMGQSMSTKAILVKQSGEWKIKDIGGTDTGDTTDTSDNTDSSSAGSKAAEKTCWANQRTVDGAIQSYNAMTEKYPSSLADMTMPSTQVLKKIPTCPSGGEYIYKTDTDPPFMSCTVHPAP